MDPYRLTSRMRLLSLFALTTSLLAVILETDLQLAAWRKPIHECFCNLYTSSYSFSLVDQKNSIIRQAAKL
ncbi:hypothetical protein SCA6_001230 [Theobroma cacao]